MIVAASIDISCALERATVPNDFKLFFPQATKKLPRLSAQGGQKRRKSNLPRYHFSFVSKRGNALCGYGPAAWPAGYPCVANGRNPVRAYLLRHGRSAVSSARGLLNASHQPASLWQGPCAYYSASSRCLLDKIAQPAPLCQPLFLKFNFKNLAKPLESQRDG